MSKRKKLQRSKSSNVSRDAYGFEVKRDFGELYDQYAPLWQEEEAERGGLWDAFLDSFATGEASPTGDDSEEAHRKHQRNCLNGLRDAYQEWQAVKDDKHAVPPPWWDQLRSLVQVGVPMALRGKLWKIFLGLDVKRQKGVYDDLIFQALGKRRNQKPKPGQGSSRKSMELDVAAEPGRQLPKPDFRSDTVRASSSVRAGGSGGLAPIAETDAAPNGTGDSCSSSPRPQAPAPAKEGPPGRSDWHASNWDWNIQIEKDLHRTFPNHPVMDASGRNALRRILAAYSRRNDRVGYCQGMNFVAAWMLLFMGEEDAFWALCVIVEDILPGYFEIEMVAPQVDQVVFKHLVDQRFPALSQHLEHMGVEISTVSTQWFICMFVNALPSEPCARVWDLLFFEAKATAMFRVALGLVEIFSQALITTVDLMDAFMLLQNMAPLSFDASRLLDTACMNFGDLAFDKIKSLREAYHNTVVAQFHGSPVGDDDTWASSDDSPVSAKGIKSQKNGDNYYANDGASDESSEEEGHISKLTSKKWGASRMEGGDSGSDDEELDPRAPSFDASRQFRSASVVSTSHGTLQSVVEEDREPEADAMNGSADHHRPLMVASSDTPRSSSSRAGSSTESSDSERHTTPHILERQGTFMVALPTIDSIQDGSMLGLEDEPREETTHEEEQGQQQGSSEVDDALAALTQQTADTSKRLRKLAVPGAANGAVKEGGMSQQRKSALRRRASALPSNLFTASQGGGPIPASLERHLSVGVGRALPQPMTSLASHRSLYPARAGPDKARPHLRTSVDTSRAAAAAYAIARQPSKLPTSKSLAHRASMPSRMAGDGDSGGGADTLLSIVDMVLGERPDLGELRRRSKSWDGGQRSVSITTSEAAQRASSITSLSPVTSLASQSADESDFRSPPLARPVGGGLMRGALLPPVAGNLRKQVADSDHRPPLSKAAGLVKSHALAMQKEGALNDAAALPNKRKMQRGLRSVSWKVNELEPEGMPPMPNHGVRSPGQKLPLSAQVSPPMSPPSPVRPLSEAMQKAAHLRLHLHSGRAEAQGLLGLMATLEQELRAAGTKCAAAEELCERMSQRADELHEELSNADIQIEEKTHAVEHLHMHVVQTKIDLDETDTILQGKEKAAAKLQRRLDRRDKKLDRKAKMIAHLTKKGDRAEARAKAAAQPAPPKPPLKRHSSAGEMRQAEGAGAKPAVRVGPGSAGWKVARSLLAAQTSSAKSDSGGSSNSLRELGSANSGLHGSRSGSSMAHAADLAIAAIDEEQAQAPTEAEAAEAEEAEETVSELPSAAGKLNPSTWLRWRTQGSEYQKPSPVEAGVTSDSPHADGQASPSMSGGQPTASSMPNRAPKSTTSWLWRRGAEPPPAPEPPPRPKSPPRSGMEQALAEMLHRPNPATAAAAAAAAHGPTPPRPPPSPPHLDALAPQPSRKASGGWLMGWRSSSVMEPVKPAEEAPPHDNTPAGIAAAAAAAAAAAYPKPAPPKPEPVAKPAASNSAGTCVVGVNGQLSWKQDVPRRMSGTWLRPAEEDGPVLAPAPMPTRFGGPRTSIDGGQAAAAGQRDVRPGGGRAAGSPARIGWAAVTHEPGHELWARAQQQHAGWRRPGRRAAAAVERGEPAPREPGELHERGARRARHGRVDPAPVSGAGGWVQLQRALAGRAADRGDAVGPELLARLPGRAANLRRRPPHLHEQHAVGCGG